MLEHKWSPPTKLIKWEYCRVCGVVKRLDGKNKPCSGVTPKIAPRSSGGGSLEK